MTTPIVKELPRQLEPVTRDTFIDRLAAHQTNRSGEGIEPSNRRATTACRS